MENEEKEIITYTLVLHQARKKLGITLSEYCVADSIYHLSNNPESKIKGWCYAPKEILGGYLGITDRTIWRIIKKLVEKELVEKDKDNKGFLRTTQLWYDTVIMTKMKIRANPDIMSGSRKTHQVDPDKTSEKHPDKTSDNKDSSYKYNYKEDVSSGKKSVKKLGRKQKPYFKGKEMRFSQNKWWVLPGDGGEWLEFAGREKEIQWL